MEGDIAEVIREAQPGVETVFDLLGEGGDSVRRVVIERRRVQLEEPPRLESPPRIHTFHAAAGFIAYLKQYGCASTVVLADLAGQSISAVIDNKAQHGFESIDLHPQKHPQWKPWADFCGQWRDLEAVVDFLCAHRRAVVSPDGRELMLLLSQVTASVETKIHRGRGDGALNGLTVKTEFGGQSQTSPVSIPDVLVLQAPIFVAGPDCRIEIDLRLRANGSGDLQAMLSSADAETAELDGFQSISDAVRAGVDGLGIDGIVFGFGEPCFGEWDRVPVPRD